MTPPQNLFGRARPRAERAGAAAIRAAWSIIFPSVGFAISVIADTYSTLPVPQPWVGITLGAIAYGIKKYKWPDTQF